MLEIKGTTACYGKVQGLARLVLCEADADKVQEGEVMIAKFTTPDLTLAMYRAGGIVTETGGILSHAAIVSRELGIPCVVGAKNAVSEIQNGYRVEIIAEGNEGKVVYEVSESQTR